MTDDSLRPVHRASIRDLCAHFQCSRAKLYTMKKYAEEVRAGKAKAIGPILPPSFKHGHRTFWDWAEIHKYDQELKAASIDVQAD